MGQVKCAWDTIPEVTKGMVSLAAQKFTSSHFQGTLPQLTCQAIELN